MNFDTIRDQVEQSIEQDGRDQIVAKTLRIIMGTREIPFAEEELDQCRQFICDYVSGAVDVLESAWESVCENGLREAAEPIFKIALEYWHESADLIPDDWGVLGLADDAYLSNCLIQSISDIHRVDTGAPLLSLDLSEVNQYMRHVLGDSTAEKLDAMLAASTHTTTILAAIAALDDWKGTLGMASVPQYESYGGAGADGYGSLHLGPI